MTEMAARYDLRAPSYERCWAPVLAPSAIALLDCLEPHVAAGPPVRLLDAGTGSGTVAIAALRRWPNVRVTGLDVSAGMIAVAGAAAAALGEEDLARLSLVEGSISDPHAAGLRAGSFDAAVSSFVLHLVPNRAAALAGLRSLLRPGGALAFVTWAAEGKPWAAEQAFDIAMAGTLARAGLAAPSLTGGPRAGPVASATAARTELQAAGFADVDAWEPRLRHPFGRADARALLVDYDRAAELHALSPSVRAAVLDALDAALARLPDGAFPWDVPLVAARAVRPPGD